MAGIIKRHAIEQNERYQSMRSYRRLFYLGLLLLILVLSFGTIGYMVIEGYSVIEAFYMTIITMSTVGFKEVRELSDAGRLFTCFLIIFNLIIFAYAISNISSFIMEAGFQKLFKDYRVLTKIDKLKDHVIICGYGRHGQEVVHDLEQDKVAFVIIEQDGEILDSIRKENNYLYVEGDATNDELLKEAGIERAGALVVTISDATENLYVVLSARQLNSEIKIITRAGNQKSEQKLLHAGANHVVLPERISGFYMARLIDSPEEVEFFNILSNMGKGRITFDEVKCSDFKEKYINCSILNLDVRKRTGINIIGLRTSGGLYEVNPSPETVLTQEMILIVLGSHSQLGRFRQLILK